MRLSKLSLLAALLAVASPSVASDLDHAPAPMIAPPAEVTTRARLEQQQEAQATRTVARDEVIERFGRAYPDGLKVAFYYNRRFSDRVSDWVSSERFVIAGAGSGTEGGQRRDGRGRITMQAEHSRAPATAHAAPVTEIQAGFLATLRDVSVRLLDPGAIARLTDADLEDGTFTRGAPDGQRLEMRALREHAEVLVELQALPAKGNEDARFRLRILNVADGSIIAVLETNALPPEEEYPSRWVAGDGGFTKERPALTLREVGDELALITMLELSRGKSN